MESRAQLAARRLRRSERSLLLALAAQEQPLRASRASGGELRFPGEMMWPMLPGPPTAQQIAALGSLVDLEPRDHDVIIAVSTLGRAVAEHLA